MISRNILFACLLCLLNFDQRCINAVFLGYYCNDNPYNPNNTTGSIYRANLDFVLSTLSSNASRVTNNGFYNFSAGSGPNTVYGLFLCRGDVNTDVCTLCVANASDEIVKRCPDQKIAIIWFDECLLRYKNESTFSIAERNIWLHMWNPQNATDPANFNQVLGNMMNNIIQAANDQSGKKFAVQEADYSQSQRKIYANGQCTPDLSISHCDDCLRNAIDHIPRCCNNHQGGRVLFASCNIRFANYQFYNTVATASTKEDGRISKQKIAAIVVAVVVAIVLLTVALCIASGSRKRNEFVIETTGESSILTTESLQYNLSAIQAATNNFAMGNRIGEGGFGPVYKGTLPNGQEIAVKRLSRRSTQGVEQFKNEIELVARLQHRNLVRLLGFCLEGEEKILIYEFVPNTSLDYFLFGLEAMEGRNTIIIA